MTQVEYTTQKMGEDGTTTSEDDRMPTREETLKYHLRFGKLLANVAERGGHDFPPTSLEVQEALSENLIRRVEPRTGRERFRQYIGGTIIDVFIVPLELYKLTNKGMWVYNTV